MSLKYVASAVVVLLIVVGIVIFYNSLSEPEALQEVQARTEKIRENNRAAKQQKAQEVDRTSANVEREKRVAARDSVFAAIVWEEPKDFSNLDLQGMDISRLQFSYFVAPDQYTVAPEFREADFFNGVFDVAEADFLSKDPDISGANFSGANLARASFSANLSEADFSGANLFDTAFTFSDLSEADFSDAFVYNADFYDADLTKANFTGADLSEVDFSKADLSETNFSGAFYTSETVWPEGFIPESTEAIELPPDTVEIPDDIPAMRFNFPYSVVEEYANSSWQDGSITLSVARSVEDPDSKAIEIAREYDMKIISSSPLRRTYDLRPSSPTSYLEEFGKTDKFEELEKRAEQDPAITLFGRNVKSFPEVAVSE